MSSHVHRIHWAFRYLCFVLLFAGIGTPALNAHSQTTNGSLKHFLPIVARSGTLTSSPLPTYNYATAMRPAFAHEADRLDLPHYDLTFRIDPVNRRLNGHVDVWFPNTTGVVLNDVVFRLYPNFGPDVFGDDGGGSLRVSNVAEKGVATTPRYETNDTVVRVPLPRAIAPNDIVHITLDFSGTFAPYADGTFPLPSFYPMLAAWQNGWRTDFSNFSDRVYASAALYHARITVPTDWNTASTGTNLGLVDHGNGTKTYEVVSGPVREFALSVGRMDYVTAEHDGTTIVIWYPRNRGLETLARTIATDTARALQTFNTHYGPYPYRALEGQLILDGSHVNFGSEYPGFYLLYTTGAYTDGLRYTAAHEIAHQWFYNVLGNDIFNEPWLDEAFAKYSPEIVEAQWRGQAAADAYYQNQVLPYAREATQPAGLSIYEYGAWKPYHRAVYGRGAQFLHELRTRIGSAAFFNGMQDYYARHKYGVVHKTDFLAAMERASGQDLDTFFFQWLGR